ncbi:hypothetical protein V501_02416 [Pseudogymnoascus sp. VKM F-4519 (FW-2642)]|nr:hypothetical protein V501_02416 [Pseudogymnoascus sp. VKM F-4519 (FW-2642)]
MPALAPDIAIVKAAAVAINPADAKTLDYSAAPGAIHGYDFAGTVVALGADELALGHLAVGDRVAGMVHGMHKLQPLDVGGLAKYVGAYADILLRVPGKMTFEEAARFGTGVATASMSLVGELHVLASLQLLCGQLGENEVKEEDGEFVLVAGASTTTGTRVIQLRKLQVVLVEQSIPC